MESDDDAEHLLLEDQGRQQHRLVEVVVGPRDGDCSGVVGGVGQVLRDAVGRHPAGDPLAEADPELVRGLVVELADQAAHRDRHEPAIRSQAVDADVVVLDELVELVGDRGPDLALAREARQLRAQLLDRLQVRRPRRHPFEVLGVLDGRRRLGREPAERRQLLLRPGVGPVVVDDQEAEEVVPVEERRRTDRVEALLDDGGTRLDRARVVAVAHREQRAARGCRLGGQGGDGDVTDRREVGVGEAAGDLGGDMAVGASEEDCGAVPAEQDPGMVDHAGEDLVQVELAADVGRDPPQGLGSMELGRRFGSEAVGVNGNAELARHGDQERLELGEGGGRRFVGGRDHAPRPARVARDRDRDPRREAVAVLQPVVPFRRPRLGDRTRGSQGAAREARRLGHPADPFGALPMCRDRHQAAVAALQHDREVVAGASTEELDGDARDLVHAPSGGDQVRHPAQQVDLDEATLHVERSRQRCGGRSILERLRQGVSVGRGLGAADRLGRRLASAVQARSLRWPRAELDHVGADRGHRAPRHRRLPTVAALPAEGLLGGGQEALEIPEAVAPVAARVDPVEAEPSLVAPGPDRVRVNAEEACRLRDTERRVGRSRREWRGRVPVELPILHVPAEIPRRMEDRVGRCAKSPRPHSSCQ